MVKRNSAYDELLHSSSNEIKYDIFRRGNNTTRDRAVDER